MTGDIRAETIKLVPPAGELAAAGGRARAQPDLHLPDPVRGLRQAAPAGPTRRPRPGGDAARPARRQLDRRPAGVPRARSMLILGVLAVGSEYGWGTWKTVLIQDPSRLTRVRRQAGDRGWPAALAGVLAMFAAGALASAGHRGRRGPAAATGPASADLLRGIGAGWLIAAMWAVLGALLASRCAGSRCRSGWAWSGCWRCRTCWPLIAAPLLDWVAEAQKGLPGPNAGSLVAALGARADTPGVDGARRRRAGGPGPGRRTCWSSPRWAARCCAGVTSCERRHGDGVRHGRDRRWLATRAARAGAGRRPGRHGAAAPRRRASPWTLAGLRAAGRRPLACWWPAGGRRCRRWRSPRPRPRRTCCSATRTARSCSASRSPSTPWPRTGRCASAAPRRGGAGAARRTAGHGAAIGGGLGWTASSPARPGWSCRSRSASRPGRPRAGGCRARRDEARRQADAERLRVAQEVHDVVGHGLAAINMQAEIALHLLAKRPEQAEAALTAISRTSREALDELRATLGARPPGRRRRRPRSPAPGLARLDALVDRMPGRGRAGARSTVTGPLTALPRGGGPGRVPDRAGVADQRAAPRRRGDRPRSRVTASG